MTSKARRKWRDLKLWYYDHWRWFRKEHESEYYNRGLFNYLCDHPEYIDGKVHRSECLSGFAFWNTTGKEFGTMYPTVYFPLEWIEKLKKEMAL